MSVEAGSPVGWCNPSRKEQPESAARPQGCQNPTSTDYIAAEATNANAQQVWMVMIWRVFFILVNISHYYILVGSPQRREVPILVKTFKHATLIYYVTNDRRRILLR